MKRLLFITLVCSTLQAAAQVPAPSQANFSIGPSVGFGHSYLMPFQNWKYQGTWNAGIVMNYAPVEWWGLGADIRYSVEGSRTQLEGIERVTELQYLRVPVKFMLFGGSYTDAFRPKFTIGPSVGFLLGESDTYDAKANSVDVGGTASIGFNQRVSHRGIWLNVDLCYYQGFVDVRQHSGMTETNGNVTLNAGLAFGIPAIKSTASGK